MSSEKYVGRGGDKLEGALDYFKIDVTGRVCLDVGVSTGGFTDCLLQRGAEKVYAVDTAYGELAWKLRNSSKVVVFERTNILFDKERLEQVEGQAEVITIDAGWTRAKPVVLEIIRYLKPGGLIVLLIKPQYEIEEKMKKTKILDPESSKSVAESVKRKLEELGFNVSEIYPSPIRGDSGNQEYFTVLNFRGRQLDKSDPVLGR